MPQLLGGRHRRWAVAARYRSRLRFWNASISLSEWCLPHFHREVPFIKTTTSAVSRDRKSTSSFMVVKVPLTVIFSVFLKKVLKPFEPQDVDPEVQVLSFL
jgi:hypothetical protein